MRTGLRTLALGLVLVVAVAAAASIAAAAGPLDTTERATLLSMREEEKLAHDVYVALAATSGEPAFLRIASAEAKHELAIERMLTLYGLADPTDGYPAGKFPTAATQNLYDELVAKGATSRAAAIEVGITIEKADIADLKAAIAQTDEVALDRVYANLLAASQRHLQAFERNLAGTGTATGGMRQAQGVGRQASRGTGACDGTGKMARDGSGNAAGAGAGPRYGAPV